MGGVDLVDHRTATCSRLMKGNIWYYKIFFNMLEVAVLNAHIMYQGAGHQGPDVRFNREHFHYPVKTATHRNCKVHIQRVKTVYECGICQVMCPAPCFECYHTLQQYLFDDPERNGAKRLNDVHGRPRAGPGRPRQRRSR